MAKTAKKKAQEVRKIKRPAEMVSAVCYCPTLEKDVAVARGDMCFSATDSECETCGSHGDITFSFDCECGNNHKVEINSW